MKEGKIVEKLFSCSESALLFIDYKVIDISKVNLIEILSDRVSALSCWGTYFWDDKIKDLTSFLDETSFLDQKTFLCPAKHGEKINKIISHDMDSELSIMRVLADNIVELELIIWLSDASFFCNKGEWYSVILCSDVSVYQKIDLMKSSEYVLKMPGHGIGN